MGKQHGLAAVWNKTFLDKLLSIEFDKKLFRVLDALDREILRTFIAQPFCNVMTSEFGFEMVFYQVLTFGQVQTFDAGPRKSSFGIVHLIRKENVMQKMS